MRQADVYLYDRLAGRLTEDETGYTFQYDADYLNESPVRLTGRWRPPPLPSVNADLKDRVTSCLHLLPTQVI